MAYGYTAFRRGGTDGWGGVLIIVKSKFICEQISISEGPELLAMKIETCKHPLFVATFYRAPKYCKERSKILFEEIVRLINKNKKYPI